LLDLAPQDFILSENITDNGEYLEVDVERSIVNNKVKYSGSVVDPGQSTHEVSLTVTNSAQIHVDYSGMGRQINIDLNKFTGQTTSAIALSVGDVYKSNSSDDLYVSLTNNNTIKIYSGSSITKAEFLQLNEEDADLVFRPFTSTVTKHKYSYHISVDGFGDNTYLIIDISFSGNDNNAIIMEYYVHNSQTNLNSNYNSFSLTKI